MSEHEPISLTALRAQVEPGIGRIDGETVLALIDVVEAVRAIRQIKVHGRDAWALQRLHGALKRFTP